MERNEPRRPHPIQRLMDNPWWLLLLGVVVPTISYTVWAWIELWFLPAATLP
jgi:hypothetical protein